MPANICICWKTENTFLEKKQQNVRQKQNHPNCCCLFLVPCQVQLKSCTAGTWTKTQASTHLPIWLSGPSPPMSSSPSPSSSPTPSTLSSSLLMDLLRILNFCQAIVKLKFGHNFEVHFWSRLEAQIRSRFWSCSLVKNMKLYFCRAFEAEVSWNFEAKYQSKFKSECLSIFWPWI